MERTTTLGLDRVVERDATSELAAVRMAGRHRVSVPRTDMTTYSFRLFVAGQTERSQSAQANLRRLCDSVLPGRYEIEVVDVAEHPEQAEEQRILATPTVVRLAPSPTRRVIGDLSDHHRTALALGLPDASQSTGLEDER